jgi:beta-N-acetylhexosaminidase
MGRQTDRRPLSARAARRGLALALALLTLAGCAGTQQASAPTAQVTPAETTSPVQTQTTSPAPTETETASPSPTAAAPTQEELWSARAEELLGDMTLHEKVCQMFVIYPEAITGVSAVISAGSATQKALEQWPVAGFLYDKKNMNDRQQVTEMLTKVQTLTKIPLILTCDEEGGRVNRLMSTVGTTYIGPMLDYKDDGTDTAFANAQTIAADLLSCGFNTDLAPVADVWSNPENTVIGDRAYSDDFAQAAQLVASAVEGFHAGGVACTLKHFPGHGNTSADSHKGAVYVSRTLDQLRENELLPFQAGIDAGADMVMIGHLIVSDIDSEPAPFSYAIVTQLLREEMGFTGVVITDGLQMKAMTDSYTSGEIALKAVQAGVDLLLCPLDLEQAVTALEDAVESGALSEARIDESVQRILTLKLRQGLLT